MTERDPLRERFAALADGRDDSDWRDVLARAGARRRRPLRLAVAVAVGVIALAVPTIGLGIGTGLIDFWTSKPAPQRVARVFDQLSRGAPVGMDPDVIATQVRQVLDARLATGEHAVLWVAPTRHRGFCSMLEIGRTGGLGGGCVQRPWALAPSLSIPGPISPLGRILRGPVVIDGSAQVRGAVSAKVSYEDGTSDTVALVWVSKPIDAAFFVYSVPAEHWTQGRQPVAVSVVDDAGKELARKALAMDLPVGLPPAPHVPLPKEAIVAQSTKVLSVTLAGGKTATLWQAPSRKAGMRCSWLEIGTRRVLSTCDGAMSPYSFVTAPLRVGGGVLLVGELGPGVATLEVTSTGGVRRLLRPHRGFVLAPIGTHVATVRAVTAKGEVLGTHRIVRVPQMIRAEAPHLPPVRTPRAGEQPLQHGAVEGATLDVYHSGLVVVGFTSADRGPYAFLAPKVEATPPHTVTIECGRVSFRDDRWTTSLGGSSGIPLGRELRAEIGPTLARAPYDLCSVRGHYGRRWDEHVGYHNAVEVPFTADAKRFFDEQAAARRLAYFIRSPKLREIRAALKRGGTAPSSEAIASRFDSSVVALSSADGTPPERRVGVWSDGGRTIVAAETAADGRRMYVTLERGRIGPNNLRNLAFVF